VEHEIAVTLFPLLGIGVATEPFFALQEMEKDDAAKQALNEIAQRLAGAIEFLLIGARDSDAENFLRRVGIVDQMFNEALVVLLVLGKEFFVKPLDGESALNVAKG
jgi:hypothetical protein